MLDDTAGHERGGENHTRTHTQKINARDKYRQNIFS